MTSGETPTGPSATKLGGYALIGVGALAAVFGVATLIPGGGGQDAAAPPPGGVASSPSSVVSEQPQEPPKEQQNPPAESSDGGSPEKPSDPAAGDGGGDKPTPQPPQDRPQSSPQNRPDANDGTQRTVVRVYNNSTIKGLAHRAAVDLRGTGYDVPEVGNYSAGRIYTTTVYFRPGTPEEVQARKLGKHFHARVEPRFDGIRDASPGVIMIVTNDYEGPAAPK